MLRISIIPQSLVFIKGTVDKNDPNTIRDQSNSELMEKLEHIGQRIRIA